MSTPTVRATSDPQEFKAIAFPFLQRDPVLNTAMLSNIEGRIQAVMYDPAPPVFVSVHQDGAVTAVVIATALRGIVLTTLAAELVPQVATALAELAPDAGTVEATAEVARPFAEKYAAHLGKTIRQDRVTRLHRLTELVPQHADGAARLATPDDFEDAARFVAGFGADTGGRLGEEEERRWARGRIDLGQLWMWEHEGRVVSMLGHHGALFGVDRIGPVYTPPACRGRGYGSALTAHVSRRILDGGATVCLFTDLSNPTSNKIYATIGYRPVTDFARYAVSRAR